MTYTHFLHPILACSSFHFIQHIVSLGYTRPLIQADIDGLMPKQLQARYSYERLSTRWNASKKKHLARGSEPSLLRIIMTSFNTQWISILVVRLLTSIMTYVSPQLLNSLLGFIQSYSIPGEENKPVTLGIILAFGLFFSSVVVTFFNAQLQAQTVNVGLEVRTALMSMVYRKAIRLSNAAKNESSAGQITNLMSVDAERWSMSASFIPMVVSVPFEIAIATWMLYNKIGWSIFIGLLAVVLMLPIHAKLSGYFQYFRAAKMKTMDGRLKLVNEVLAGMKIVKLYNWEDSFREKVAVVRRDELKLLKKFGTVFSFVALVFLSTPLVITLVSLAVFTTHGGPNFTPGDVNPQTIFVSISLFGLLSRPISSMSSTLSQITSITVATRRIQKFLLSEELDETMIVRESEDGQDQSSTVVEIQDAVFAWCPEHAPIETEKQKRTREKEEAKAQKELEAKAKKMGKPLPEKKEASPVDYSPALVDINLSVSRGELVAVVGRVGQGKTSLLSALIGEMYKRQGTVRIRGKIAYAAQQGKNET